jgi:hypothetical protein
MDDPDELYGLPLEQFIPERGALAKALRQAGDRERAKEVAGMRKPSVAAWAVNQLVRAKRKEARELFEAGDALQHAQSELLEGHGDGKALREAVARERHAVDELTVEARGLLSADGHELTAATLEKVSDTLHAAALDPEARERVEQGRLERELRHVGLGAFGAPIGGTAAPPRPRRAKATEDTAAKEAEEAERRRAAALKAARQAERDARRAAQRAERELHAAEARREDATTALADAEDAVAAAREQTERTATALEEAAADVERLET